MSKSTKKILFLLILFISLSFQSSMTQIHVPHSMTLQATKSQDVSKDFVEKSIALTDEMLQFTSGGHILGFRKGEVFIASVDHALRIEFVNARAVSPVSEGVCSDAKNNQKAAKSLERVTYSDLWDGVTLMYERHNSGVVKSTYIIQPSETSTARPVNQIILRYNMPVALDERGNMVISFGTGQMIESHPVAWQEIEGKQRPVEVSFRLLSEREVGFAVGSYNSQFPLVIDPILRWITFMGSGTEDYGRAIAVDSNGNVYVAGYSDASWGVPVNAHAGGIDAFAAKLNSFGVRQWHTFMGSGGSDYGYAIAVDSSGNIYVAGDSYASWGWPLHPYAGGGDAFVARLNSNGERQWHRFIGSEQYDSGRAIAVDSWGNIYVAGTSDYTWGWPVHPHTGENDAFAVKLRNNGERQWNTFMGAEDNDYGRAIAVDSSGNVYVAGTSDASWGVPLHPYTGGHDVFVAKLNSLGERQWHTFMGSEWYDYGSAIAVDSSGNVYVAGISREPWGTPVNAHAGGIDAFAAKLNSFGVRQWHTFMGSGGSDYGYAIAVDSNGSVYVAGTSYDTWGTPVHPHTEKDDAFAAKLNFNGTRLWHTFMGSERYDYGYAIAVDSNGSVYVTGDSSWPWGMPINSHTGFWDAFAAKLEVSSSSIYIFDGHDFDGNGKSDVSVFRPSNGRWYIKDVGSSLWGTLGDIPANGDYNGDGTTDIAVWRPANGRWYIIGVAGSVWGTAGDIPVPGNYNGDVNGTTDIAVWRPSNGRWYIQGSGSTVWGTSGDIPVPGDYNGDGTTEIAVWRPSNGRWYIQGIAGSVWGTSVDIPVPADYNGDGVIDIAVWRPSNGRWYIKGLAGSVWGTAGDIPAPGDYNGDGITDIAVWRPSNGRWYIKGIGGCVWGMLGDIPLVR
jgi:uncharacterized delta-60 repeat protein